MASAKMVLGVVLGALGLGGLALAVSGGSDKKTASGAPPIPDFTPPGPPPAPSSYVPPTNVPPNGGFVPPSIDDYIPTGYQQPPPAAAGASPRFGTIKSGEGPRAFVTRVTGSPAYGGMNASGHWGWHHLEDANPELVLNAAGDNYVVWEPGQMVKIPDDWPGGVPALAPGAQGMTGGIWS